MSENASPVAAPASDSTAGEYTHRQILTILSGLMLGMFLGALDQTIVSTSIRTIADDLDGLSIQAWVTTSYLITATITTPIYGKLGDNYGRKKLFMVSGDHRLHHRLGAVLVRDLDVPGSRRSARPGLGAGGLFTLVLGDHRRHRVARGSGRAYDRTSYFMAMCRATSSVLGPLIGRALRRPGRDPRHRRLALGASSSTSRSASSRAAVVYQHCTCGPTPHGNRASTGRGAGASAGRRRPVARRPSPQRGRGRAGGHPAGGQGVRRRRDVGDRRVRARGPSGR